MRIGKKSLQFKRILLIYSITSNLHHPHKSEFILSEEFWSDTISFHVKKFEIIIILNLFFRRNKVCCMSSQNVMFLIGLGLVKCK